MKDKVCSFLRGGKMNPQNKKVYKMPIWAFVESDFASAFLISRYFF